jgi:RNA polymerase sigma-70 factor (subfamily 1)
MNFALTRHSSNASANSEWQTLLQEARDGDDDALGQLVSRVYQYLIHIVRGEQNVCFQSKFGASDIVQQSMIEAHQSFQQFKGGTEVELRGWLRVIVLNNLIDNTRKYRNTSRRDVTREISLKDLNVSLENSCDSPGCQIQRQESDKDLINALHRLPERQRQVVVARHRYGRSYRQIAADIGSTEVAARKLWSRGIQNLKDSLLKTPCRNE